MKSALLNLLGLSSTKEAKIQKQDTNQMVKQDFTSKKQKERKNKTGRLKEAMERKTQTERDQEVIRVE